jgi:CheY-like chemotaxis protein
MKKILVIDDAEYILESTSTLLGFEGYEVITASNGYDGIEKSISENPDLIICDISMPGIDGYGVLNAVREGNKTKSIPFIFLTAFTDKSNLRAGMEKGADDYLFKPFTRDELVASIEALFKKNSVIEDKYNERIEVINQNITNALPHEFITVLNQIIGSAKFMNSNYESITKDDIKEISSDIIISTQRLLKITENYLIYLRIESFNNSKNKKNHLRKFRTDEPAGIIIDVANSLALLHNRKNDIEINGIVTEFGIEISSESFYKIIFELIDNAFNFSKSGSNVLINMYIEENFFNVEIIDSGRGISEDQLSKVGAYIQFEREIYEQQGVGLGLSIAKKLVELHDGIFSIESKIDEGTKIKFSLPCCIN